MTCPRTRGGDGAPSVSKRRLTGTIEQRTQQWTLDIPRSDRRAQPLLRFVHFPLTTIFLVLAFARHRDRYPAIRNWFGVTLSAMVIHVVFPLPPPRMLDGYVDTLREYGPSIYPEDPGRSLANQFAAMPSLHFGWALMVSIGLITITKSRRRWWWIVHPAVTLLATVASANHYLLDAAIAAALAWRSGCSSYPTAAVSQSRWRRSSSGAHRSEHLDSDPHRRADRSGDASPIRHAPPR